VTGYISSDPRSPANTRQPILRGFLSVEIIGKNNEPLWSYLVTPSRLRAGDITKDLAQHLAAKLVLALEQKSESAPVSPATEATGEMTLTAAGATFPAPLYQKWFELFHQRRPNLHIKYNAVGSEAGLQALLDNKLDFAASDMPLSDERMAQSKRTFLHFASVIGAVVPVYNVKGVDRNLNFTPAALAGIYLGKIKKWNDPAIREWNRNATLPDDDIAVVHRSDGSGTTFVWSDYLSKVNPEWKASVGVGDVVRWPAGTSAEGNDGVATMVQQTPNSIGYGTIRARESFERVGSRGRCGGRHEFGHSRVDHQRLGQGCLSDRDIHVVAIAADGGERCQTSSFPRTSAMDADVWAEGMFRVGLCAASPRDS